MIRNALALAIVIYAVLLMVLLKECAFLGPVGGLIWQRYGEALIWSSAIFIINMFAAAYALLRKLALKDTGDKLSHLEKQLRGRTTVSEELTERILQRK